MNYTPVYKKMVHPMKKANKKNNKNKIYEIIIVEMKTMIAKSTVCESSVICEKWTFIMKN